MLKRKIVAIICLIFIVLLNILYTEYLPFLLLCILLTTCIILFCYSFIMRKFIKIELHVNNLTLVRGDKQAFEISINNTSIFPVPNIVLDMKFQYNNCSVPMTKTFVLDARSVDKTSICAEMELNYCGILEIGFERIYLFDLLKVFRFPIKKCNSYQVTVLPKLIEPDYIALHSPYHDILDSQYYSKKTPGSDVSEIFDVREYREGDIVSRIHWKLSAKEDNLIVKELSMPIIKSDVILVELFESATREDRKNLDGVFEMVYAIGNFACRKERVFKIMFYSNETGNLKVLQIESRKMLIEAIYILIQESTYSKNAYSLQHFREAETIEVHKVYYITSQINEEIIEFLDHTKDNNFYLYCMDEGSNENDTLEIEGALLFHVDRNNIKQSLNSVFL